MEMTHRPSRYARLLLAASITLLLPGFAPAASARAKPQVHAAGCALVSHDPYNLPQGLRTIDINYTSVGGVCPSDTTICLDPPLCYNLEQRTITYTTPSLIVTVAGLNGNTLYQTTVTPPSTIFPSDGNGNPITLPRPQGSTSNFTTSLDVSALTASGPTTVYWSVESCPTAEPMCGGGVTGGIGYTPPVPAFTFDVPSTEPAQRVLTHKYGSDDAYPLGSRQLSVSATARPQVLIKGKASVGSGGVQRDISFRLFDPPDRADYVPANDRKSGDNADINVRAGRLFVKDAAGNFLLDAAGARITNDDRGVLRTTSASDGSVTLVLETSDQFAGDNYQIEASFERATDFDSLAPTDACASCTKSAIYEMWKRVYIERDRMFRHGTFLTDSATGGGTNIFVDNVANLGHVGQILTVRFIHAPPAIPSPGPPGPRAVTDFFYSEDHQAQIVPAEIGSDGMPIPEHLVLQNGDSLSNTFGPDPDGERFDEVGRGILRDAVGVITGNNAIDFFEADMGGSDLSTSSVGAFWATLFVDLQPASDTGGSLPFVDTSPIEVVLTTRSQRTLHSNGLRVFGDKWFLNGVRDPNNVVRRAPENVQHVMGARQASRYAMGATRTEVGGNFTYIFVGRMELNTAIAGDPLFNLNLGHLIIEDIAHELAHQWNVNSPPPAGATEGHCVSEGYRRDGTFCRMHAPFNDAAHLAERADGNIQFHYNRIQNAANGPVTVDSEYLTIRNAAEPVPNQ